MRDAPAYYAEGPEALVVNLAARGDRDAFTELVRRRQKGLRTLFRRFSGNPELADNLAQDTFLKAWRKISQLKQPERFGGWIKKIAINEWIDYQRKHANTDDTGYYKESLQASSEPAAGAIRPRAAEQDRQDDLFTTRIANSINHRRKRIIAGRLIAVLLLIALEILLESPLQESLGIAAQILGTSLVPIDNEWLAFALAPINSLAGLLGMLLTGIQHLYRKLR